MSFLSRLSAVAASFGRSDSGPDPERERQVAVVALLIHVARADGRVDAREVAHLTRLVASRLRLGAAEATAVIAEAEAMDDAERDLAALVEVAAHDADADERQAILAMAWSVAAADGHVHEFEEAQMTRLSALLGLDDAAAAVARAFAEQGIASPGSSSEAAR